MLLTADGHYLGPVRVLLVSTYELGHQPLHIASPAAALIDDGHAVECLDLAVEPWDDGKFEWAEAVAFSVPMHTAMRLGVQAARRLRLSRPGVPVAFYGLYAAVGADRTLPELAERLIVGEYEDELRAWVNDSSGGRGIRVDLRPQRFRVPARHLLPPLDRYARLEVSPATYLAGYVEASHGCRHRCRHCPIPAVYDGRYRTTGLDVVLADVAQLKLAGARHITFGDPDFLNAPRYALDVLREVNAAFPDLTFDLTAKVEHILHHATIWDDLARRNVIFVVSAFETTNNRILSILDKGHTVADMGAAVSLLRAGGIEIRPSWLPFTPWTGPGDLAEIFEFLAHHDLLATVDPVQLSIRLLIPEGSLLLNRPEMAPYLGAYDGDSLTYQWQGSPAAESLRVELAGLAEAGADTVTTIERMWRVARPGEPSPTWPDRAVPRLTEAWFCCAEPTTRQLEAVASPLI